MFRSRARAQESELELLPSNPSALQREAGPETPTLTASSLAQEGWPDQPQRLKSNASENKLSTAINCILAFLPLIFLGLAVLVLAINGREVNERRDAVIQATRLGPTVFPIVFAAIVGSMMRNYALWRAQNGAALGLIEQLNGSTSFAGTIELALALRHRDLLMIPILLLWAMSPLGGQGALRMISQAPSSVPGDLSVAYLNMNVSDGNIPLVGSSSTADILAPLNAIYTTLILSSEEAKASPSDVWGWPKIPSLLSLGSSIDDDNPWRPVPADAPVTYTSLVGHVLQGIPPDSYAEFPIESSYFDFDCHMIATGLSASETFDAMGGNSLYHNASNFFNDTIDDNSPYGAIYSNFFIDTGYNLTAPSRPQSQVNLFYGSKDRSDEGDMTGNLPVALFNCTMSFIRLEAQVACENSSCAVTRMRRSEKDKRSSFLSPFNDALDHRYNTWTTLHNIIRRFPHAVQLVDQYQPSPTDSYIYGEPSLFNPHYYRDWSTASAENVSTRFSTVFNTFYQASMATFVIPVASMSDPVDLNTSSPSYISAEGTTFVRRITVYRISLPWLIVFIAATILLLLSALAGLFLKSIIIAPDILGYVSSLTRDNPHISLPAGGSTLSGEDRAKLLRDLPVQIADVDKHRDFGRIVLASRSGDTAYEKLHRRRRYE
ncbi:hypothetical protein BDW59DRAFT_174183 [Aspergillus cavernicola]|uniref:Uncharacterized protein n=1 Tax=Aspergillus cavernicola TaxID=176166 RepID=A0ABR4I0N3_9EURO